MYYYMYTVEGAGNRKPLRVVVPRHTPSVPAAATTPADQGSTTTKETFRLRETDNTLPFSSFFIFLLYSSYYFYFIQRIKTVSTMRVACAELCSLFF